METYDTPVQAIERSGGPSEMGLRCFSSLLFCLLFSDLPKMTPITPTS